MIEAPSDSDNFLIYWTPNALTVTDVSCKVSSATSAVVTLQECDANGGSCVATAIASGTCATTKTSLTVTNSDVDSGDSIVTDIGTVTGSPGYLTVCLTFTE